MTQAPSDPVPGVLGLRTVKPLLVPYVLLIVGQPGHQPPNLVTTLIQFRLDRPRSVRAGAATPRPAGPGGRRAVTGAPGAPGDGPGHPGGMADDRCLPMFPLSTVLFPYSRVPLHVFEPRYRCMVDDCLAGDGLFGVVLIARGSEVGGGDERLDVGTVASIETAEPQADGRWHLIVAGLGLIRVRQWLDDEPYPRALVHDGATMPTEDGDTLRTAVAELRRVRALLSELGEAPAVPPTFSFGDTPDEVAWRLCALAPVNPFDRQRLLEASSPQQRLAMLLDLIRAVGDDVSRILASG